MQTGIYRFKNTRQLVQVTEVARHLQYPARPDVAVYRDESGNTWYTAADEFELHCDLVQSIQMCHRSPLNMLAASQPPVPLRIRLGKRMAEALFGENTNIQIE